MKTAEYELVLMLDAAAPEQAREALAAETRSRIESAGELRHAEPWGIRKLAYEIEQRGEADYRFYRFSTEAPTLDELRHALRIADGVLRFRIFEVDSRSPLMTPPEITLAPSGRERDGRGRRGRRDYDDSGAEEGARTESEPTAATQPDSAPEPPESPPARAAEEPEAGAPSEAGAEPQAGAGERPAPEAAGDAVPTADLETPAGADGEADPQPGDKPVE